MGIPKVPRVCVRHTVGAQEIFVERIETIVLEKIEYEILVFVHLF